MSDPVCDRLLLAVLLLLLAMDEKDESLLLEG